MAYTSHVGEHSPSLTIFHLDQDVHGDGYRRATGSLFFQDGPVLEFGRNGTTNEEVIQLLIDRITSLNEMANRKYACRENSLAITKLEEALHWLQHRTAKRVERGVEGTHTP